MERLTRSSVLVIGMGGLGLELSKNIVLAGVKNIGIYDPAQLTMWDLGSQVIWRLLLSFLPKIRSLGLELPERRLVWAS